MATDLPTTEDLDLLRRPLHGFLTVAGGSQPRPVWFEVADDGTVQIFSAPGSPRMRHLRADPRASLVVAAPVGERERWVSVAGRVTIETDGATELCRRLGARYWDLDDPARAADLAGMLDADWLRIVIHPDTVRRSAY